MEKLQISENKQFYKILEILTIFIFGALCYGLMEVLSRGFTHISMGVLGGISFVVIHILNDERIKGKISLFPVLIISGLFITSIEFLAGEYLNRILGLNIWNYKDMWLNVDEQICLPYTILWSILSLLGIYADNLLRNKIFKEDISIKISKNDFAHI